MSVNLLLADCFIAAHELFPLLCLQAPSPLLVSSFPAARKFLRHCSQVPSLLLASSFSTAREFLLRSSRVPSPLLTSCFIASVTLHLSCTLLHLYHLWGIIKGTACCLTGLRLTLPPLCKEERSGDTNTRACNRGMQWGGVTRVGMLAPAYVLAIMGLLSMSCLWLWI